MTGASQTTPRESRLLHAASLLTIGIAAWTVLTTIAGVIAASCNLPYADEWDLWTSLLRHGYSLGWFFELHNDHRIATTRLIFAASHLIFHGRIWVPQATSLTVQAVLAVLLWKFARRLSAPGPADGILAGTTVCCLFSGQQSINFFWGFQVQFFLVYALAAGALFALTRAAEALKEAPRARWMIASLLLAAASSYSMANGVLLWPILVSAALCLRLRRSWIAATAACGLAVLAQYFTGWHRSVLDAPAPAGRILRFALAHAGTPIVPLAKWLGAGDSARDAIAIAAGGIAIGGAVWMWLRSRTGKAAALAHFAVFTAAASFAIASGRAHLPLAEAFRSRYITPAYILWVSVLLLAWPRWRAADGKKRSSAPLLAGAAAVLLVAAGIAPFQFAKLREAGEYGASLQQASAALAAGVNDPDVWPYLLRPVTDSREAVEWLRQNHLAIFSEEWTEWVGRTVGGAGECAGGISQPVPIHDSTRPGWRIAGSIGSGVKIVVLAREAGGVIESASPVMSERWTLYAHPGGSIVNVYGLRPDGRSFCLAGKQELR